MAIQLEREKEGGRIESERGKRGRERESMRGERDIREKRGGCERERKRTE